MDTNNILKLIDAGFTADEIRTMMGGQKPEQKPEQQPEQQEQKPEQQEQEQKPDQPQQRPDRTDEVLQAINKLTKAVQLSNVRGSEMDDSGKPTVEESLQRIMQTFNR